MKLLGVLGYHTVQIGELQAVGSHRWLDLQLGRGPALETSSNNEGISKAKSSKLFSNRLRCAAAILVHQQNLGALIDPLQCLDFQSCYLQAHKCQPCCHPSMHFEMLSFSPNAFCLSHHARQTTKGSTATRPPSDSQRTWGFTSCAD